MVEKHWEERLNISNRKKTFAAKDINIDGDLDQYNELAVKYLDENYNYSA